MYFMSDPQALHVTRNVIPGKLGVDLHLHTVCLNTADQITAGQPQINCGDLRLICGVQADRI